MAGSNASLLPRLLASAVTVANQAGKIIRDVMKKGELGIVQKENAKDLQTEADRAAQQCIISSLSSRYTGITVIGEEEQDVADAVGQPMDLSYPAALSGLICPPHLDGLTEDEVVVWVDPLDGTAEYTQGLLDHVTVLIGIAVGGRSIAGVIHQPYYNYQNPGAELGRTIWGVVGHDGKAGCLGGLKVLPPPAGARVVATTRSHASSTVNDAVEAVKPTEVLRVGGAGHKVLLLLDGVAHAYVFASPGCKKWDTCAPQAVLAAAGGKLTDIAGLDLQYHSTVKHRNSEGVLATAPGEDHTSFVSLIPQHIKDNLKA